MFHYISSHIGTLPIDADLTEVENALRGSGYRLFRRGRGVRNLRGSFKNGRKMVERTEWKSYLPLKMAERQALYLRKINPSFDSKVGTSNMCTDPLVIKLLTVIVSKLPNSIPPQNELR